MILQTLPDVDLDLLDTLSYKIYFSLKSSHGRHKLSKSSFNVEGRRVACDDDAVAEVSIGTGRG